MNLTEIMRKLREQVDWRSPISGRPQNIVTLPREHAIALLDYLEQNFKTTDDHTRSP